MCQQEAVLIGWANSSTGGLLQVLQQKADAKVSHPMSGSASWHIWGGVWTLCPGSLTDEYVLNGDVKLSPRQCYDSGSGDDGSCEVKAFFITHFGFHTGGTACAHIPKNNNCIFFKSSRVTQSCQDRIWTQSSLIPADNNNNWLLIYIEDSLGLHLPSAWPDILMSNAEACCSSVRMTVFGTLVDQ